MGWETAPPQTSHIHSWKTQHFPMERASLSHGHLFSRRFWVAATQLLLCWARGDQDRKSQSPASGNTQAWEHEKIRFPNSRHTGKQRLKRREHQVWLRGESTWAESWWRSKTLSGMWMSTAIPRGLSWSRDTESWKEKSVRARGGRGAESSPNRAGDQQEAHTAS